MVPAERPHLVPCFGAALLSGTRRSHFWGRPVGSKMGPDPAPEFMFFFGPKEEPQTQLVVISCSWVLLWFGVPCFGALKVGESSSYLGDPQKLHVWQSEKHV